MGSTTLTSTAGLARRFATVPGDIMSANMRCSSSQTLVVPLGDRLGVPSGLTVATNPSRCSRTTRFMSSVRTAPRSGCLAVTAELPSALAPSPFPGGIGEAAPGQLTESGFGYAGEVADGCTRQQGCQGR